MGHAIVSGGARASVPSSGIMLRDIVEGSLVKLNENGSPVEFYVAKHDYESSLNGAGRTLLVRKNIYDNRIWDADSSNYASSDIDIWLNGYYKNLLDSSVKTAIGTTNFYYSPNYGSSTVTTLGRSVFLLSLTELSGSNSSYGNTEGSILPISDVLKIAYYEGSAYEQWTRTPAVHLTTANYYIYICTDQGYGYTVSRNSNRVGSRPCFTLPSESVFDQNTLVLKGVA